MRKANRNTDQLINKRLAEVRISERARERASIALRDAEGIVNAIIWIREKLASLGSLLLKPGFKH
jgi:hypothetical protein